MDRLALKGEVLGDPTNQGRAAKRVVLYTIPGKCPLCEEARELLVREGVEFAEIDIRTDRALLRAYREEIPVVTVGGKKEFVGRVDAARLRGLLGNR